MLVTRSTLVYDGDCGICRTWVDYWRGLTGDRVLYRPYQEAAPEFPGIPREAFANAVQLIEPDGKVYSGAAATYRVIAHAPGRAMWWWLYKYLPGFASTSEAAYGFFSRRRGLDALAGLGAAVASGEDGHDPRDFPALAADGHHVLELIGRAVEL